jgi:hypothetical protein
LLRFFLFCLAIGSSVHGGGGALQKKDELQNKDAPFEKHKGAAPPF